MTKIPTNVCKYSFNDLERASGMKFDFTKPMDEINQQVKNMCVKAGWYWQDVHKDGISYTSFSKTFKEVKE